MHESFGISWCDGKAISKFLLHSFLSCNCLYSFVTSTTTETMRSLIFEQPNVRIPEYASARLHYAWQSIRSPVIIPLLKLAVILCSGMSIMLFVERVVMAAVILMVKLLRKKKYTAYKLDAIKQDLERNKSYPMVLIQIPMYNEKEVYKLSIGAACGLSWPSDRFIVQVLDDSTNEVLRELVELECLKWIEKGVNVKYETRRNRNGYKAGALKEGLEKHYVSNCEFVTIFDADFQPDEDFLWRTIPYLAAVVRDDRRSQLTGSVKQSSAHSALEAECRAIEEALILIDNLRWKTDQI